jgi:phosphoribosylaminoimidazole carboxylase PurK protein
MINLMKNSKLNKSIGIIGGGQLGQMLTQAALPLGFDVTVLDPQAGSPAYLAGADQIVGDYNEASITKLAAQSDYLTTEFEEGLDTDLLSKISSSSKLNPAPKTIALILDKVIQKNYLKAKGVAMGQYTSFETHHQAGQLLKDYGGKMLIKTRRGGYDGYGNRLVDNRASLDKALSDFAGQPVYAEAFVPFIKELAVMAVRDLDGAIITYPVVETIQKNNICHEVLAPAQVDYETMQRATDLALKVAGAFDGAGAFGIEMFLTQTNELYLNEVAPRVHNSGHYSIEACVTSQFENHIRAISGRPIGSSAMKVPFAVMINILGERNGPAELKAVTEVESDEQTYVHIYGKSQTRIGRKMGHITATGISLNEAKARAEDALKEIYI